MSELGKRKRKNLDHIPKGSAELELTVGSLTSHLKGPIRQSEQYAWNGLRTGRSMFFGEDREVLREVKGF